MQCQMGGLTGLEGHLATRSAATQLKIQRSSEYAPLCAAARGNPSIYMSEERYDETVFRSRRV
jgi:hypothetical protein